MKPAHWALVSVVATAGAAGSAYVFQPGSTAAPVPVAVHDVTEAKRTTGAFVEALSGLDRAALSRGAHSDPFMTSQPRLAPASAPAAVAPARPALPAFPYKYAGTLKKTNGVTEAFLLRGADLVQIKAGDLLDGTWRIEALTADRLEVTFVPAGERMAMALTSLVGEPGMPAVASTRTTPDAAYGQVAGPAVVESSPSPARANVVAGSSISGGFAAVPGTPAPVVVGPRVATNASAAAASSTAASAATSIALGSPMPLSATPLGSEPSAQGTMPLGSAPNGTFPRGETPTGKLGL